MREKEAVTESDSWGTKGQWRKRNGQVRDKDAVAGTDIGERKRQWQTLIDERNNDRWEETCWWFYWKALILPDHIYF
jgi:hypothetical protein